MQLSVLLIAVLAAAGANAATLSGKFASQLLLAHQRQPAPAPAPSAASTTTTATTPLAATTTTGNTSTVADPDVEARNQFVRQCVVVVSVESQSMLPVEVAEKFCDTTTAIVECKQTLARRLEEVHKQNGDVSMFCISAYEWFQKKYGMQCPKQCHKLQCVSTCNWLKELHDLEEEGGVIDDELQRVTADNTELKNLKIALKEQERDVLQSNRTVEQRIVELDRAKAQEQNAKEDLNAAQNKSDAAKTALGDRDKILEQKQKNISDTEAELTATRFKIDKANVEQEGKQGEIERLEGNKAEIQAKLDEEERKLAAGRDEIKVLEKMANADVWKAGNLSQIIKAGNKTVAAHQKDYEKAKSDLETMLAKAKASDADSKDAVPDEVIEEQKDLIKQTKGRVLSSTFKTQKVMQSHHKVERTVELTNKKIKVIEDTLANITQSAQGDKTELAEVNTDIEALKKKLNQSAVEIQSMNGNAGRLQDIISRLKKELKTQNSDNESEQEVQDERHAALKKAKLEAKTAHEAVSLAEDQLAAARASLKSGDALRKSQAEKVKAAEDQWEKENGGLLTKVTNHKEAMQKLERRKPEIVRQHSLALWQMAGFF